MAFNVAFLMCSFRVRQESIHMPRYLMVFDGAIEQETPSVFVGMVMEGPGPACLPLLDGLCEMYEFTFHLVCLESSVFELFMC